MSASFFLLGLLAGGCLGYFGAWTEYRFFLQAEKNKRLEAKYAGYQQAIYDMSEDKVDSSSFIKGEVLR